MNKFINELFALAFTIAGSLMVIITLGEPTRSQAIWITVGATIIHLVGTIIRKDNQE